MAKNGFEYLRSTLPPVSESRIKRIKGLRGLPHTFLPQALSPGPLSL